MQLFTQESFVDVYSQIPLNFSIEVSRANDSKILTWQISISKWILALCFKRLSLNVTVTLWLSITFSWNAHLFKDLELHLQIPLVNWYSWTETGREWIYYHSVRNGSFRLCIGIRFSINQYSCILPKIVIAISWFTPIKWSP